MVERIVVDRSKDSGQQFLIPARAMVSYPGLPRRQSVLVEVLDLQGQSYGTFGVPVDPSYLAKECAGGKWAVKVATGACWNLTA